MPSSKKRRSRWRVHKFESGCASPRLLFGLLLRRNDKLRLLGDRGSFILSGQAASAPGDGGSRGLNIRIGLSCRQRNDRNCRCYTILPSRRNGALAATNWTTDVICCWRIHLRKKSPFQSDSDKALSDTLRVLCTFCLIPKMIEHAKETLQLGQIMMGYLVLLMAETMHQLIGSFSHYLLGFYGFLTF